jgi:23S rRNA (guanosine2251-2'-O)-methyltransferase
LKKQHILFGVRPVIEALKEGKSFEKVLLKSGMKGELTDELRNLLLASKIHFQYVPIEKLNRITRKNHQGVIGYTSLIDYHKLDQLMPTLFEEGKDPFVLVLDRITDVRNLGAIARTAECAGVDIIVIPLKGSAMINEDAMKTSAGALSYIKVCKEPKLKETLKFLKESGLKTIGATEKAAKSYSQINYSGPLAVFMGSEEDGISPELLRELDELVKIPIMGKIDSLNVSVATGIVLYEAVKQKL